MHEVRSQLIRALDALFAVNRRVCGRVERLLPQAKDDLFKQYVQTITGLIGSRCGKATVLDVGGGKQCPFAAHEGIAGSATIIAVDISPDELEDNHHVDAKVVADIEHGLPFRSRSIDLITSRSVLEHISDVGRFVQQAGEALKPGGYWVHLFPSKFSLFALINQLLPNSYSRALLYTFRPETRGICGFPAHYNRCYYSGIRRELLRNGLDLVVAKASYYQSPYFNFFFPLFAVSALYEVLAKLLRLRNLAAYLLVVARKTEG
jgi:SAM-dependent methyltransferase